MAAAVHQEEEEDCSTSSRLTLALNGLYPYGSVRAK